MAANPQRKSATCLVTNTEVLEVFEVRRKVGGEEGYEKLRSNEVLLTDGVGWGYIKSMIIERSPESLGWVVPRLVSANNHEYKPVGLLGTGRGAEVYLVTHGSPAKDTACKVFGPIRQRAFDAELQTLQAVLLHPHPALPRLVEHNTQSRTLLTQPVTKPLGRMTYGRLKEVVDCLMHLHTTLKLVHRDIEVKHLGEVEDGGLGVLDLGSAASLDGAQVARPNGTLQQGPLTSVARVYAGTLTFAADSVLEALAEGRPPEPHVKEDLVAVVKTIYVLVHASVAQDLQRMQQRVAKAVNMANMQDATGMVKQFWEQEFCLATPAGLAWRQLVLDAHNVEMPDHSKEDYEAGVKGLLEGLGGMLRAAA